MFTGIVEAVGAIAELKPTAGGCRLRVETPLSRDLNRGDSLAVNGVCLTAVFVGDGELHADIGPETARITTLGSLQRGERVNLERALRADARLGGHFVLGHVDGVGVVHDLREEAGSHWLTVRFPDTLAPYFIRKGSVAVDGVSLTIAGLSATQFDVQVVPFTWEHTALSALRVGARVNIECDMVGKYIVRAIELTAAARNRS